MHGLNMNGEWGCDILSDLHFREASCAGSWRRPRSVYEYNGGKVVAAFMPQS